MAITSLLGDAAATINGKRPGQVNIDNKVFQLHYRVTTFLFLAFSLLSTVDSLLGDPINCACKDCLHAGITLKVINTHCWVTGTYTVIKTDTKTSAARRVVLDQDFYGLGPQKSGDGRKYYMYYQWVPFVLFLQGVMFYVPHWIWEINEDGRIQALAHELRLPTTDRSLLQKRVHQLTGYVADTLGSYDGYYMRFLICDMLNIANVVCNLVFTNRFLNHEFMSYGPRCIEYFSSGEHSLANPMSVTFPKLTKCQFQSFGASGSLQNVDAICVMALNIFNEKIYLLLWFWLVILCIITVLIFCFRTALMLVRGFRAPFFQRRACTVNVADIDDIVLNIKIGDFFFLSLLAKNLDITAFRLFLSQIAEVIRRRRSEQRPAMGRRRRPTPRPGWDEVGPMIRQPRGLDKPDLPVSRHPSPARLRL